jgi:hypothetical protein
VSLVHRRAHHVEELQMCDTGARREVGRGELIVLLRTV